MMNRVSLLTLLLALSVVTGCDKASESAPQAMFDCRTDVAEWREDVRLHDGQIVQVWRRATACAGGFPSASRGRDLEFELRYEPMRIHWRGAASRQPVAFEIFDGVPYLVLYMMDRKSCNGQPPDRYVAQFLKWENGSWIEVPQADFRVEKALLNLHAGYWGHTAASDAKGLIGLDAKYTGGRQKDSIKDYFERGARFCDFYQKN